MYLSFYGLAEKPFELTPNPKFLFQTPGHREALAQLIYGVQEMKGFMLMTGEVGTGKTTLLRALIERLHEGVDCAFIMNSTLPFDEILEYMLADLGIDDPRGTRAQRLIALNRFLITQHREGRKTVVIIDEAQNLAIETLEQIRLLSNFENSSGKLLQIILSGQPELHAKLKLAELRQLRQRIGLRCILKPMTAEEIEQYITSHLRVARARDKELFTTAAIQRIAQYSAGIPRVVNMLCDHCLLIGYANQTRQIDIGTVRRAIEYLEDGVAASGSVRSAVRHYSHRTVAWSAGAMVVFGGTAAAVSMSANESALNAVPTTVAAAVGGVFRWLTHWWGS